MRIIRCKNSLTVILSGGRILQTGDCNDEMFEKVKVLQQEDNEFEMINLLIPEKEEESVSRTRVIKFHESMDGSKLLTWKGSSVYWEDVSPLSMPMGFAEEVMLAEKKGEDVKITAYRNFWTLLSLNPDPVVRENLFKFLEKWGMVITRSGLFVGYRNVCTTDKPDVYTDQYTHSMDIEIGKRVTMPRIRCDSDSSVECSRGLHIGGTSWLEKGYFGNVGLACLVNPVEVSAVPWANAEYGKLRCCAYLPIAKVEFDDAGHVVPFRTDSGFEEPFVTSVLYDGAKATEEDPTYVIPQLDSGKDVAKTVSDRLYELARQHMNGHR